VHIAKGNIMATERTLSIIKPDATARNLTGKINAKFEDAGLRIVAQKRIQLTKAQAGKFYEVHAERPFYDELCEFMASAPVVVQVLEGRKRDREKPRSYGGNKPSRRRSGHNPRRVCTICR
jgi:nucleoside-diphosphate kinase